MDADSRRHTDEPGRPGPQWRGLERAEPAWLDDRYERFGAPPFLWNQVRDEMGAETFAALQVKSAALKAALVAAWRRWRSRYIEGEWRD